jgi:hypothetical protein
METLISIDPGENIGVALWGMEDLARCVTPIDTAAFLRRGSTDWQGGVEEVCWRFRERLMSWPNRRSRFSFWK